MGIPGKKLSKHEVDGVLYMLRGGAKRREIAAAFHMSHATIDRIKKAGSYENYLAMKTSHNTKQAYEEQLPGQMSIEEVQKTGKPAEETVISDDLLHTAAFRICRIAEEVWGLAYYIDKDAACDWMRSFLRTKEQ